MIISSFLSGLLGSMGLGGGTILIVYLTLFRYMAQTKAQGINIICFIPIAILAVIVYSKQKLIDRKIIFPLIIYGCIGALIGFYLLTVIPSDFLGKLFGGFLIVLSVKEFFIKSKN